MTAQPVTRRVHMLAAFFLVWAGLPALAENLRVKVIDQNGKSVPNALVMLGDGTVMPPNAANREVGQANAEFDPSVSVVSRGTAVDFPNRDRARHHVYSFSDARTFEIELYKGTPADPILFDRNGIVTVGCNVHDWMYGVIYVIDTPYYAVTGRRGGARVERPNATTFELSVWHPDQAGSGVAKTVEYGPDVARGLTVELELRQTAARPSRPPPIDELDDY